jgi:accessory gene regulator B
MFSIEKLTNNIAENISSELKLDNDRKEIIAYGAFALLHMVLSIVLVIIFGWMFGVSIEALIVSFSGSILRKYSGGVHSNSPGICAATGTILAVGQALLISYMIAPLANLNLIILLGLLTFAWAYYVIYKLAPVDSAAKPIKTLKKRERMKKGSMLILDAYLVIVILNIVLYSLIKEETFLVFSLCIYGGTVWQAFTLTRGGHLAFSKIDAFINQISTFIRRIIL